MTFLRAFLMCAFCAVVSLPVGSAFGADAACNLIKNFKKGSSVQSFIDKDIITCGKSGSNGFSYDVTPLEHAVENLNIEAFRAILQADPSKAQSKEHSGKMTILEFIVTSCAGDKRSRKQEIPREKIRLEMVNLLIDNGADVDAHSGNKTLLDLATYKDRRDGNSANYDWTFCDQIADALRAKGAKTYAELTGKTSSTPVSKKPAADKPVEDKPVEIKVAPEISPKVRLKNAITAIDSITLEKSVWKDAEGNFNTSRLVSDSVAGVVLGTAGGVITSVVVKKNQLKKGFEDIVCTVGGQEVGNYGDEIAVGVK